MPDGSVIGSGGSSVFNPLAIGGAILGGLFGGGGSQPVTQQATDLHLVNPLQQQLYQRMYDGLSRGDGDFGYGTNVKSGLSQLQQMMASRGVSVNPNSGAYAGAAGNVIGQAAAADATARRNYMMQLLSSPLQTATISGRNYVPGSPSNTDIFNQLSAQARMSSGPRIGLDTSEENYAGGADAESGPLFGNMWTRRT